MPPYCITENELRRIYDVILKILTELNYEAIGIPLKEDR
jgi:adenosylmethionine-8-amino-7-oxononanoate aminotransferase